jgi:hypothetical protein
VRNVISLDLAEVVLVPDVVEPARLRIDLHLTHTQFGFTLLGFILGSGKSKMSSFVTRLQLMSDVFSVLRQKIMKIGFQVRKHLNSKKYIC